MYMQSDPSTGVWYVTAGDYVVVEPIVEGNKVQAEIAHILFPKQIKHLKETSHWSVEKETNKN